MLDSFPERWALVTGASSGIGAAFARKLASLGMHVALSAPHRDPLEKLAADLRTNCGIRTLVVACDLTEQDQAKVLIDHLKDSNVCLELLVNNAGFGVLGGPTNVSAASILKMLRLNVSALTELTYLVLPEMMARQHGAIINVSSLSAFQPVAYMAAYAASKAYVLHFTEALWAETQRTGVTVTAVCPGYTRTAFWKSAGVPDCFTGHPQQVPEQVVEAALKALRKRLPYVVSGWRNYLLSLGPRIVSRQLVVSQTAKFTKQIHSAVPPENHRHF